MTVLELRPVSLAHSGEYKCQTRDADLSPHQDDFIINVKRTSPSLPCLPETYEKNDPMLF